MKYLNVPLKKLYSLYNDYIINVFMILYYILKLGYKCFLHYFLKIVL